MKQAITSPKPRSQAVFSLTTPAAMNRPGRVLPAKTPIFHQGDSASHIYKVNSGVIMCFRLLEDSQRQITGFYTAGDFFGLTPDETYHNSALTVATSNVVAFTMADVSENKDLQQELFLRTCYQLDEAQKMMMTLSKKTASEKVAAFLVMLAKRRDTSDKKAGQLLDISLPMSRSDIADYLGLTIETVSRRLTDLKSKGVIKLPSRHTAQICEITKLETMAGALH